MFHLKLHPVYNFLQFQTFMGNLFGWQADNPYFCATLAPGNWAEVADHKLEKAH
jgi:hypothetical protein